MAKPGTHFVGIDIGSSKVAVLIGHRDEQGGIEVVGKGMAPNRGTRKGNVVNVEATVEALKSAAEEAEVMAGVEVERAFVGLSGVDVRSVNARGMVSVARRDREITATDIRRVLDAAQAAPLPSDRQVLHAVPQEFIVDEQGGIADPLGMLGSRLEVAVHLVTTQTTRHKTLLTCVNRAGIAAVELVFEPLASAEAVLTHDERELGAMLLDIGAGNTSYAYFTDGEVHHSAVSPIGAGHFTADLAQILKTPFADAERIKVKDGCCLASMVQDEEGISVPSVAGGPARVVPKRELCEILGPRAEELFRLIREDLTRNGCEDGMKAGVVLTGGGAQLDGLLEMAEQIFDVPVRYGLPRGLTGLVDVISCPTWCTASGLLLHGLRSEETQARLQKRPAFGIKSMVSGLRGLFSDLL
jgi:cell division protein FtsA